MLVSLSPGKCVAAGVHALLPEGPTWMGSSASACSRRFGSAPLARRANGSIVCSPALPPGLSLVVGGASFTKNRAADRIRYSSGRRKVRENEAVPQRGEEGETRRQQNTAKGPLPGRNPLKKPSQTAVTNHVTNLGGVSGALMVGAEAG